MSSTPHLPQQDLKDTLVVIPAWNESKSIRAIIESIREKYDICVLVVDDGSDDGTGAIARQAGAEVLTLPMNMGAWTAIQAGFRYALARGYQRVVTMDADGQHFAESIPALLQALAANGADVVIGGNTARASRNRQISWSFFRMLTAFDLQDFTSGLKAYNRRAVELLLGDRAHLFDYQDLGTLLLLRRCGMEIREIPVPMQKRKHGHSRIFSNWWQVIKYMMLSTVLCMSKYRYYCRRKPESHGGRK